jgi:hypothetical protein
MGTSASWSEDEGMKKKHGIMIGCGAVILVAVCVLVLSRPNRPAPPAPQTSTPEQAVEYLASERFVKADRDDRQQYIQTMRVADSNTPVLTLLLNPRLPEQRRQKVIENILPVVAPAINQRLDEFEQLPPAERIARLDAIIDQMQAFRKEHPKGLSSAERFNLILQYVDPHTRARLRKHLPALRERMKQRGLPVTPVL